MLKEYGLNVYNGMNLMLPKIEYFYSQIKNGISFVKINHSFWEMLSGDERWINAYSKLFDKKIIDEVKFILTNIDKSKIKIAVSAVGCHTMNGEDIDLEKKIALTIKKNLPKDVLPFYAVCWKIYALDGSLKLFFEKIRNKKIIVVGLMHLFELEKKLNLSKFYHYELDLSSSRPIKRMKVLKDLKKIAKFLKSSSKEEGDDEEVIFIFQAGELFSTWLIYNLSKLNIKKFSFIDMGRSLDYFCPNKKMIKKDENIYPLKLRNFYNQIWLKQ